MKTMYGRVNRKSLAREQWDNQTHMLCSGIFLFLLPGTIPYLLKLWSVDRAQFFIASFFFCLGIFIVEEWLRVNKGGWKHLLGYVVLVYFVVFLMVGITNLF